MALFGHSTDECSDEARAGALMLADYMAEHAAFNTWLVKSLAGDAAKAQPTRKKFSKRWYR